jgi:hypothetical protein
MMTNRFLYSRHIGLVALLALSFLISACGGSSSGSSESAVSGGSNDVVSGDFSGSVIDGPVVGATVKFYDKDNNLIQTVTSDVYANYSTSIKVKGKAYPLTIEVVGGTDLVTGRALEFKLSSFVPHPTKKKINITPFTTLIVETARSMPGGVSEGNIAAASAVVMDKFNFGSDPDFVTDPFGTGFTDENVAITLLSSDALGEMLRRVRDRLRASGVVANADDVIGALADDLADGVIDGVGGSRAQGRITALIRLVSAQVLIEVLGNNLMVDGARAADKLDAAIAAMRPSAPASAMTEFVQINSAMLVQVRTDVAAARVLAPSAELTAIANILDTILAGSLPSDIELLLPADSSADLDPAITLALVATDEQLYAVNSVDSPDVTPVPDSPPVVDSPDVTPVPDSPPVVDSPDVTPVPNSAPVINSIVSQDGALLVSYSVDNAFSYAEFFINGAARGDFDSGGGGLKLIPDLTNGVTYNITMVVYDADFSQSPLSNQVSATVDGEPVQPGDGEPVQPGDGEPVQTGSFTLNWTAPVARSDGTPLSLADIDGFRVYYSASPGSYPNSVAVTDGSATSITVRDIPVGAYYMVMTTNDSGGRESAYSGEISKIIQ